LLVSLPGLSPDLMSLSTLTWTTRSETASSMGGSISTTSEGAFATQPLEALDAEDGNEVRLTHRVSRYTTHGFHSVEARLLEGDCSRQSLEICFGYRLPFECAIGGAFGHIRLTDYEACGIQSAFLFSEGDFAALYIASRGSDVHQPKGAMTVARRIMVNALATAELRHFVPWLRGAHKRQLLVMLGKGVNLGKDAPRSEENVRIARRGAK
jgi:hypothetical protein